MAKICIFIGCAFFALGGVLMIPNKPWIGLATLMISGANLILMSQ